MDLGLTQAEAARRWGLSQPYVSLVEQGRRPVPERLVAALGPPVVPAGERHRRTSTDLGVALGNLGYPGFRYLANGRRVDPVVVVLEALRADDASPRGAAGAAVGAAHHADLDWPRLLTQVKALTLQNDLGFLASLARRLATREGRAAVVERLLDVERELEDVRLVKERPLGRRTTDAEARHVRARHAAFRGLTPDGMYFGTAAPDASDLPSRLAAARAARLLANRAVSCPVCPARRGPGGPVVPV